MGDYYILNADHTTTKVSLQEWSDMMETTDRRVAYDELPDGRRVSTVFLGLDHSYWGGPPLLFETMVFSKNSYSDEYMLRYTTWKQAKRGHEQVMEELRREHTE